MKSVQISTLLIALMVLASCSTSRYSMKNDKAPLRKPTSLETANAQPQHQDIYPWSIKPYKVNGKRYVPLKSAKGYRAQGVASWYGRKFHGHDTANGEVYDMFAMTAAHKTLPIPSYAKVINLANNKSVIVRINDRGPFHGHRIIDLSYSAAYALGVYASGTAKVSVEAIVVDEGQSYRSEVIPTAKVAVNVKPIIEPAKPVMKIKKATTKQIFVQVMASGDQAKINQVGEDLSRLYRQRHQTPQLNNIYKLQLGPLQSEPQARALISALKNNGYPSAYMLYTTVTLAHN